MAKRKTKAQKLKTKSTNKIPTQTMPIKFSATEVSKKETSSQSSSISIYQYDPIFLKKDLLKTVIFSLIILGIQISIYFWLR